MRLTEKWDSLKDTQLYYGAKDHTKGGILAILSKLGKLEDFEDKLGVDLLVKLRVEMAIADNIIKNKDTKVFCIGCDGSIKEVSFYKFFPPCITVLSSVENQCFELRYKDYGKTWALTREELQR